MLQGEKAVIAKSFERSIGATWLEWLSFHFVMKSNLNADLK
ncbi:hypothetical protein Hdeb2414_s0009g00322351 [Helianthus debilis subsp. tardiflorus]